MLGMLVGSHQKTFLEDLRRAVENPFDGFL